MVVVVLLCVRTCFAHNIHVSYGTLVVRRTLGYFGNIHDTPCGDVVRTLGYSWNIYDTPGCVSTPTYLSTKYSSRSEYPSTRHSSRSEACLYYAV